LTKQKDNLYIFWNRKSRKDVIESDSYLTVEGKFRHQIKVRSSTFIGTLAHAEQKEDAEDFIENIREEFHDATHNCFGYRIDADEFRYSDDGEPAGTAGKPILAMINKHQLQQVALTVTRFFGGTKLGTGGLIRAYGDCADQLIEQAPIITRIHYQTVTMSYGFDQINQVQHLVHKYNAQILEDATPGGMRAQISIPPSKKKRFLEDVVNFTSGKIKILSEN
jgi:uncharacterized YigZ family protein